MGRNDESYRGDVIDKGVKSVDVSDGIGKTPDRFQGVVGSRPLVGNGMTTAVKRSDNSQPGLNDSLNSKAAAAQRAGTVGMPTKRGS